MRKEPTLKHERLKEVLDYDPERGLFTWRKKLGKGNLGETAGSLDRAGYVRIMIDGERLLARRLAWFYVHKRWPVGQIDHINVSNSDNRICNLREANQTQNQANRGIPKNNTTGFKGVSYLKEQGRFTARLKVNRRLIHLGTFLTAEEASAAYQSAANDNFGAFARAA